VSALFREWAAATGADRLGDAAALTDGYSAVFLGAAGIAVAGAVLAAAALRTPKATAAVEADTREEASLAAWASPGGAVPSLPHRSRLRHHERQTR
jgi:hypothetical protein